MLSYREPGSTILLIILLFMCLKTAVAGEVVLRTSLNALLAGAFLSLGLVMAKTIVMIHPMKMNTAMGQSTAPIPSSSA